LTTAPAGNNSLKIVDSGNSDSGESSGGSTTRRRLMTREEGQAIAENDN